MVSLNDLPKDIIKVIFKYVLHDKTITEINRMKLVSKIICKSINECPTLYHGKYISWWHKNIIQKRRGFRHAKLRRSPSCGTFGPYEPPLLPYVVEDWWWYDTFDDHAIRFPKTQQPEIVRFMD